MLTPFVEKAYQVRRNRREVGFQHDSSDLKYIKLIFMGHLTLVSALAFKMKISGCPKTP